MLIEVSNEKAKDIISTKHPKGLFFTLGTNGSYIAINNATGDASTKTFQTREECFSYLTTRINDQMHIKNNNNDMVHHPNHYNYKSMECKDIIDIMCEGINEGQAYKLGCAIKYLYRYPQKGKPVQDLEKAKTYIDMIIKEIKKGEKTK